MENPNAGNNNTTTTTTTTYLVGFVYESRTILPADPNRPDYSDSLMFISHDEGRIRLQPVNNKVEYDYMIKDHLGNIRMVLTEEVKTIYYPAATLEGTYSASAPMGRWQGWCWEINLYRVSIMPIRCRDGLKV